MHFLRTTIALYRSQSLNTHKPTRAHQQHTNVRRVSEWLFVLSVAAPVVLVDEVLKMIVRAREPVVKLKYD